MRIVRLALISIAALALGSMPVHATSACGYPLSFPCLCTMPAIAGKCAATSCTMDASAGATLRVEACGANGFDTNPDTCAWEAAVYCSETFNPGTSGDFGTVEGTQGAVYYIDNTISVANVRGGKLDGRGSTLMWTGPNNGTLLSLEDTGDLTVTDFQIRPDFANLNRTMDAAIRLTNPGGGQVTATHNVIEHVFITAQAAGCSLINYGVVFDSEDTPPESMTPCSSTDPNVNLQCNNDVTVIRDSTIANTKYVAIDIRGANSYGHLIDHVNSSGEIAAACSESRNSSIFVHTDVGSFTTIDTLATNFDVAVFKIETNFEPIAIIDNVSENSGCLIWNPQPTSEQISGHNVEVIGGRFGVENLTTDGHVVNWNSYGNLQISSLFVGGQLPTSQSFPTNPQLIYFNPSYSTGVTNTVSQALLKLSGLVVYLTGKDSSSWDPVHLGPYGRLQSTGNTCKNTDQAVWGNKPCIGLLGGVLWNDVHTLSDLNAITSGTGASSVADGQSAYCSDCKPHTSPCAGSGAGAMAVRTGGQWDCGAVSSADLGSQSANTFLAGPSSGSSATPTFRTIQDSDVPNNITISLAATATALSSDPTDCASGTYATAIAASGNLTCNHLAVKERTRTTDYQKVAADLNAAATTAEAPVAKVPGYASTAVSAHYTPGVALTCSNTNYATITVYKRTNGGTATQLFSQNTKCTGGSGSWTAFAPVSLGTSTTSLAADDAFTWQITKSGTGVVVPAGVLTLQYTIDTP